MNLPMGGWKTWLAAALAGASAVLKVLGYNEFAEALALIAGATGLVGLGSKIERGARSESDEHRAPER